MSKMFSGKFSLRLPAPVRRRPRPAEIGTFSNVPAARAFPLSFFFFLLFSEAFPMSPGLPARSPSPEPNPSPPAPPVPLPRDEPLTPGPPAPPRAFPHLAIIPGATLGRL